MNLLPAFVIPIWESALPNFNQHRDNWIKIAESLRAAKPDCAMTYNIGGAWMSDPDSLKDSSFTDLWTFLGQSAQKATFDMQFQPVEIGVTGAWFNVTQGPAAMHLNHVFVDIFNGVVFVKSPPGTGSTVITNPATNPKWDGNHFVDTKNKLNSERIRLDPTEGKIFLWPSYMQHSTEPNQHDDTSISISFRMAMMPKQPMLHVR